MRVSIITSEPAETTAGVRQALVEAGHALLSDDEAEAPDVAVVVVSGESGDGAIAEVRHAVESVHQTGRPIIAVTLTPLAQLDKSTAALPHDDGWVEITDDPAAYAKVIDAVGNLSHAAGVGSTELVLRDSSSEPAGRLVRIRRKRDPAEAATLAGDPATNAPTLFISYSRRDKMAGDVCDWLTSRGYTIWRDTSSIPGAADYRASIEQGIRNCDMFVVLLSPNVMKNPAKVTEELQLADSKDKPILPVFLRKTPALPEGAELILTGKERIDIFPDFGAGMARLVDAIGSVPLPEEMAGLRGRAQRARREARRFARQHEIGSRVKKYGGVFAAGGVVVAAALGKALADQEETNRRLETERDARSRDESLERQVNERAQYIERTLDLLNRAAEEIRLTDLMRPQDFREEFRPRMMRILGSLEATPPASPQLRPRHEKLVANLDGLMHEFDDAVIRFERGDQLSYTRSIARLNAAWAQTLEDNLSWLQNAIQEEPSND
jgi:TIR domain